MEACLLYTGYFSFKRSRGPATKLAPPACTLLPLVDVRGSWRPRDSVDVDTCASTRAQLRTRNVIPKSPVQKEIRHRLKYNVKWVGRFQRARNMSTNSRCSVHGQFEFLRTKAFHVGANADHISWPESLERATASNRVCFVDDVTCCVLERKSPRNP